MSTDGHSCNHTSISSMIDLGSLLRNFTTPVLVWNPKIFSLFIKSLESTLHRQFAYYIIPTHRSFVSTVQSAILLYCFIYIFYTIIIIVIYLGKKINFCSFVFRNTYLFCRCLYLASSFTYFYIHICHAISSFWVLTHDTNVVHR
jgi:hypothetical protein